MWSMMVIQVPVHLFRLILIEAAILVGFSCKHRIPSDTHVCDELNPRWAGVHRQTYYGRFWKASLKDRVKMNTWWYTCTIALCCIFHDSLMTHHFITVLCRLSPPPGQRPCLLHYRVPGKSVLVECVIDKNTHNHKKNDNGLEFRTSEARSQSSVLQSYLEACETKPFLFWTTSRWTQGTTSWWIRNYLVLLRLGKTAIIAVGSTVLSYVSLWDRGRERWQRHRGEGGLRLKEIRGHSSQK